jgi:hypothetical protein
MDDVYTDKVDSSNNIGNWLGGEDEINRRPQGSHEVGVLEVLA